MALTNTFYEAVESNEVISVRIMMKNSLRIDPTFKQFEEMERIAASMENLYDVHDGQSFQLNRDDWDDEYMD